MLCLCVKVGVVCEDGCTFILLCRATCYHCMLGRSCGYGSCVGHVGMGHVVSRSCGYGSCGVGHVGMGHVVSRSCGYGSCGV